MYITGQWLWDKQSKTLVEFLDYGVSVKNDEALMVARTIEGDEKVYSTKSCGNMWKDRFHPIYNDEGKILLC